MVMGCSGWSRRESDGVGAWGHPEGVILSREASKDLPCVHWKHPMQFYVYIMAGSARTLYIGVTTNLLRRVHQHRTGCLPTAFTARYRIVKLVHYEITESVMSAIAREKQIKGWRRERKIALIERDNPDWRDLARDWLQDGR
jgi:putative endonuclease